jgi:hypothetical protein
VYDYFTLRFDEHYSKFIDADLLCDYLCSRAEFKPESPSFFGSATNEWFHLALVQADGDGNYSSDGEAVRSTNCLAVTAATEHRDYIVGLLRTVANYLGWQLIDHESEESLIV